MKRDARLQAADAATVAAAAKVMRVGEAEARSALERMREAEMTRQATSPYRCGYEPPIWFVAKALLRNPAWSDYERDVIKRRFGGGTTAEAFAEKMRGALGFDHPVTRLLIMGSNRSGKTDFAAKLCVQTAMLGEKKVCSGAQTLKTQKKNQMARVWHYMPEELRARNIAGGKAKGAKENISYTEKNGFAGSRVIFANGSSLDFVSYEQTTASQEGVEYDLVHLDEEYPCGHYDLYTTRITSRGGCFLGTFTPLHGYTAAVAAFLDGAEVVREHVAYLRPKDGGEREPWSELNLTRSEYEKLAAWRREGADGDCGVPESRPEDCFAWIRERREAGDPVARADGRVFDRTPRVCRCQGGEAAAIWFYGSDNPYGLPAELMATKMAGEGSEKRILASVYGVAQELKGKVFSTAAIERATVPAEAIPEELVRFMVCDPSPERNWCFGWFGYHVQSDTLYMYREWPGNYEVPGQGVPGPWAVASDRNDGQNDGARGEGQVSFGWGYAQIFAEVERVECGEEMEFRLLDSRAAAQSKISRTTNRTLLEDLEDYADGWMVADGQRLEIGYTRMIDKLTAGKLRISSECKNTLACMKMLTGKDGQKGACKDMVDLVRYAVMSDIWDYRVSSFEFRVSRFGKRGDVGGERGDGSAEKGARGVSRGRKKSRVWW